MLRTYVSVSVPRLACSLTIAHSAPSERACLIYWRSASGPFEQAPANSNSNSSGLRDMRGQPPRRRTVPVRGSSLRLLELVGRPEILGPKHWPFPNGQLAFCVAE